MAGRHRRRSHYSSRDIGHERALQHIEDYRRLERELGASLEEVKQYFFALTPRQLEQILRAYGQKYGNSARNYAEKTIGIWKSKRRQMGGQTAERLFSVLPPYMPLALKYRLVESLWHHVGTKSRKTLKVGLDASTEQVIEAVRKYLDEVVVQHRISTTLEGRFNWLSADDARVKQDLLNHLRQHLEKTLAVDAARLQLPVMQDHLRGDAGRQTHRLAQIIKVGNHELELLIDKNASGVAVVEPYVAFRSAGSQPPNFKWLWWVAAAVVALFLFSQLPAQHSSYQPSMPSVGPSHQSSAPPALLPQSNTRPPDLIKPATPALSSESNRFSDHGPGRIACDGQWSALHRSDTRYHDFMVNCMKNAVQ